MKRLLVLSLMVLGAGSAFGQNLLLNPGFETGDLTDWVANSVSGFSGVNADNPHSGSYAFQIGALAAPPGGDDIYQIVSDSAGTQYTLSLWETDPSSVGIGSGSIEVLYNGTILSDIDPTSTYEQVSFTVTGTGSDKIEIEGWNSPAYSYVDDASFVAASPEPVSMAVFGMGALALLRRRRR